MRLGAGLGDMPWRPYSPERCWGRDQVHVNEGQAGAAALKRAPHVSPGSLTLTATEVPIQVPKYTELPGGFTFIVS